MDTDQGWMRLLVE